MANVGSLSRVRAYHAGGGAFVACRSIEVGRHRMQKGALPVHADTASPLFRPGAGNVITIRKLQRIVVTRRLIRIDARLTGKMGSSVASMCLNYKVRKTLISQASSVRCSAQTGIEEQMQRLPF